MSSTQFSNPAAEHFQRLQLAAIFRVIYHLVRLEQTEKDAFKNVFDRFPFLLEAYQKLQLRLPPEISWEAAFQLQQEEIAGMELRSSEFLPLRALQNQARLSHTDLLALMLTGIVEDSQNFCALFQQLQSPSAGRRPGLELLSQILTNGGAVSPAISLRHLLDSGVVEVLNPAAPRAEWQLRVPPSIWDLLHGDSAPHLPEHFHWHPRAEFSEFADLVLLPEERAQLQRLPDLFVTGQAQALVIRAMRGMERLQIAGAIARALGREVISVDGQFPAPDERWALLGPICTLTQALPVFCLDLAPGETYELPQLNSYAGPVIVILGHSGGVRGQAIERAVSWTMRSPNPAERRQHWATALAGHAAEDLNTMAERLVLPGDYIRQTAAVAINQARLENETKVRLSHVREAARLLNRQQLETLAQHLKPVGSWRHLVVSSNTHLALQELERRCRYREALMEQLGPAFAGNLNRGVRALFNGPSGTGKTLAARILAAELEMDLYRVDLSAVVNKYIGETEKNLHQIFSRAEELDVILLLDEGDSLLTNRTKVQSSNDRYANLETNYLLQRLENYAGILLITSNAGENIDRAFQRRLDVRLEFYLPEAEERWHIWQLHLPANHTLSEAYLQNLAARCALSGGQIRNAVLYAASAALDENASTIGERHVELAIANEYCKAGSVSPLQISENTANTNGRIERLLAVIH